MSCDYFIKHTVCSVPESLFDNNNEAKTNGDQAAEEVCNDVARVLERAKIPQIIDAILSICSTDIAIIPWLDVSLCKALEDVLVLTLVVQLLVVAHSRTVQVKLSELKICSQQ